MVFSRRRVAARRRRKTAAPRYYDAAAARRRVTPPRERGGDEHPRAPRPEQTRAHTHTWRTTSRGAVYCLCVAHLIAAPPDDQRGRGGEGEEHSLPAIQKARRGKATGGEFCGARETSTSSRRIYSQTFSPLCCPSSLPPPLPPHPPSLLSPLLSLSPPLPPAINSCRPFPFKSSYISTAGSPSPGSS